MKGYYSLVQFCPDMSRLEAVNIGLLLFCPDAQFIGAQTLQNNKRVKSLFRGVDEVALDAAKQSLEARLRVAKADFKSIEDLQRFVDTRANELRLTTPRPVKVENPQQELEKLLLELVGKEATATRRPRAKFERLDSLFSRLAQENRAQRDVTVTVPITGRQLKVPYAYQNGTFNLVQPQMFKHDEDTAIKVADHLATQGRLIHVYGDSGTSTKQKLIVVPQFEQEREVSPNGLLDKLDKLFVAHDVKLVRDVDEFADQVAHEAKLQRDA